MIIAFNDSITWPSMESLPFYHHKRGMGFRLYNDGITTKEQYVLCPNYCPLHNQRRPT